MTCNLRTLNSVIRNVIRNIRAKQGIILGIDDDMQFTDRKLFLTDHHKLYGPYDQYIKTIYINLNEAT